MTANMRNIRLVAVREYLETVKTKTFIIGIVFVPLVIGAMVFLSMKMQVSAFTSSRPDRHMAVVCQSEEVLTEIIATIERYSGENPGRQIILDETTASDGRVEALKSRVSGGSLDALVVVTGDVVSGDGRATVYTRKLNDMSFMPAVRRMINNGIITIRLKRNNLSPDLFRSLNRWIPVQEIDLATQMKGDSNRIVMVFVPFFFLILMFFGIFNVSQGLLSSVIEEKSSRVNEVLLSMVRPFELMAGKILGQSAVGLTLVSVYVVAGGVTAYVRGITGVIEPMMGVFFILYYLPGFLLLASIITAIGSTCSEIREAQQLMFPVTLMFIAPMFLWMPVSQNPQGTLAVALSFVPPITPMIMIIRLAVMDTVPVGQVVLSLLLLVASVPVVIWLSAKVFRTGILMYGKAPTLPEIIRWIKYD